MKIEHIAIWSQDIERLKEFYVTYFGATSNNGYENRLKGFKSYFLSFEGGTRIEIMNITGIQESLEVVNNYTGYCHIAISVKTKLEVVKLTEKLKKDGYKVVSLSRTTGDGYFESVILDPDGNRIEIVKA